jgi:hypothetical protein
MRRVHRRISALVVGLILGSVCAASGQTVSATTGAMNGKITDTTGARLPGVTITISGPSMQGTRTDVTTEDGVYRFPSIPPGDYKITYELSGFETVAREDIRVGLGFTATVNVELGVASLAESITVRGQSPVVDIAATEFRDHTRTSGLRAPVPRRCHRRRLQRTSSDCACRGNRARAWASVDVQCALEDRDHAAYVEPARFPGGDPRQAPIRIPASGGDAGDARAKVDAPEPVSITARAFCILL